MIRGVLHLAYLCQLSGESSDSISTNVDAREKATPCGVTILTISAVCVSPISTSMAIGRTAAGLERTVRAVCVAVVWLSVWHTSNLPVAHLSGT